MDEAASHPAYGPLLAALARRGPRAVARAVAADVAAAEATHGTGPGRHLVRVDPVPLLLGGAEWERLAAGLRQRVAALEAFAADAHGPREAWRAGVVPADLLDGCPWAEAPVLEIPAPPSWVPIAGPDVVRDAAGGLRVLEDNTRTPTLMALAVLAREAVTRHLPAPTRPAPFVAPLRRALLGLVPDGASACILGRDGGNSAAWEVEALGRLTGWPVVALGDLERRGERLARRAGGAPVDVLWRRTSEERLLDDRGRPTALAEVLLEPLAAGTLQVVNPFGAGVADDKRTGCYVEALVRHYLGEEPLLPSVRGWDLGDEDQRADVMGRLRELVLKPRAGSGGRGVVVGPRASRGELAAVRRAVEADPSGWVAQEPVAFSTHPTVVDGRVEPRHVDLRPFVVGGEVLPGGACRFAAAAGEQGVNLSQGGGGKDVWVLGG